MFQFLFDLQIALVFSLVFLVSVLPYVLFSCFLHERERERERERVLPAGFDLPFRR